jgi:Fe-S cluster assembly scaffold protein SufB
LLVGLCLPGLAAAQVKSPEAFAALFAEDAQRQVLDRPTIEAELKKLIDQLQISDEDKQALSAAVMELVDSVSAGDVQASYEAAQNLEDLVKELQAKYQKDSERGVLGTAKAVWKIVTALHARDTWG